MADFRKKPEIKDYIISYYNAIKTKVSYFHQKEVIVHSSYVQIFRHSYHECILLSTMARFPQISWSGLPDVNYELSGDFNFAYLILITYFTQQPTFELVLVNTDI